MARMGWMIRALVTWSNLGQPLSTAAADLLVSRAGPGITDLLQVLKDELDVVFGHQGLILGMWESEMSVCLRK